MSKLLSALFIVFYLTKFRYVLGWSARPATYFVIFENKLSDILWVHCKSADDDRELQSVLPNRNYTMEIHTLWFTQCLYFCGLTWDDHGRKVFDAFRGDQGFVDTQCGGRHCFWRIQSDGIYLYTIWKGKYGKKYDWDKFI